MAPVVFLGRFAVVGECNALFALPAAPVGSHHLVLEVTRDLMLVGRHGAGCPDEPRRHGIGVAIEADGKIGVDLGWRGITAVREECG